MVRITRRFYFSAAHRYEVPGWSDQQNLEAFGACVRTHGHNYVVEITVEGPVDPKTGMVMNLTELKRIGNQVVERFDHRNLNEDLPEFRETLPTSENLARVIFRLVRPLLPEGVRLYRVRVHETEDLFADFYGEEDEEGRDQALLGRRYRFSAAHRLHSEYLSEEENRRLFGKCFHPRGHGHDYLVYVGVYGPLDPLGRVANLAALDRTVLQVLQPLQCRWLDQEVPALRHRPATTENLALYLWQQLQGLRPPLALLHVRETRNNFFEIGGKSL